MNSCLSQLTKQLEAGIPIEEISLIFEGNSHLLCELIESANSNSNHRKLIDSTLEAVADVLVIELLRIARKPPLAIHAQAVRTQLEALKYLIPKLAPSRYGDQLQVNAHVGVVPVVTVSMSTVSMSPTVLVEQKQKTVQVIPESEQQVKSLPSPAATNQVVQPKSAPALSPAQKKKHALAQACLQRPPRPSKTG